MARKVLTARQEFTVTIKTDEQLVEQKFPGLLYAIEFIDKWLKDHPQDLAVISEATVFQMVETGVPLAP